MTASGWWRGPRLRLGLRLVLTWLGTLVVLELLSLRPSVPLLAAATLGVLALGPAARDPAEPAGREWVAGDLGGATLGRGSDHATTMLAHDLLAVTGPDHAEPAQRIHARLRASIEAALWRSQGVDLRADPAWADRLLPPDLAAVYTGEPDPARLRPAALAALLTRIEQL